MEKAEAIKALVSMASEEAPAGAAETENVGSKVFWLQGEDGYLYQVVVNRLRDSSGDQPVDRCYHCGQYLIGPDPDPIVPVSEGGCELCGRLDPTR